MEAGRNCRKPWQCSSRNDNDVAEDGDGEKSRHSILYSSQLVSTHVAPLLPDLGSNSWACSPSYPKRTVGVTQVLSFMCSLGSQFPLLPTAQAIELGSHVGLLSSECV